MPPQLLGRFHRDEDVYAGSTFEFIRHDIVEVKQTDRTRELLKRFPPSERGGSFATVMDDVVISYALELLLPQCYKNEREELCVPCDMEAIFTIRFLCCAHPQPGSNVNCMGGNLHDPISVRLSSYRRKPRRGFAEVLAIAEEVVDDASEPLDPLAAMLEAVMDEIPIEDVKAARAAEEGENKDGDEDTWEPLVGGPSGRDLHQGAGDGWGRTAVWGPRV